MYALKASGIVKKFPGVNALQDVDFSLEFNEIHALMGENGAGKSTLVKVLTGVYQADGGTIEVGGKTLSKIDNTKMAFDLGISVIHQELNLLPHLDVATNIYVGRLPKLKSGFVDWKKVYRDADEVLRQVAADFSSREIVRNLSVSQQQLVEIAKSVSRNAKILFFDEPTSSLTPAEVKNLFRIMRNLKEQGISMVYNLCSYDRQHWPAIPSQCDHSLLCGHVLRLGKRDVGVPVQVSSIYCHAEYARHCPGSGVGYLQRCRHSGTQ